MKETGKTLRELCDHIVKHQVPLFENGIYFYDDDTRAQYYEWSEANLHLWQCIDDSLRDPAIRRLVGILEKNSTDQV